MNKKRKINKVDSDSSDKEIIDISNSSNETSVKRTKTNKDVDLPHIEATQHDYIKSLKIIHKILQYNSFNIAKEFVKGESKSLPAILGLSVKKVGLVSLPVQEYQAEELIKQSSKCKYGKNAFEIHASQITIQNEEWKEKLDKLVNQLKDKLGCSDRCAPKLDRLLIIKSGGSISKHKDVSNDVLAFGKLIIQLPSLYSGGDINVSIKDEEKVFDFGRETRRASYYCHFVSFYSDLAYKISKVNSGFEMFLVYDLVWSNENGLNYLFARELHKMEDCALESLILEDMYFAIELNNDYQQNAQINNKMLQGNDKKIYKTLEKINNRLPEDKKFTFSIVHASVVASQLNRHPARKNWCRGGGDCDCGCLDNYEDDDSSDSGKANDNEDNYSESSEIDTDISDEDDIFDDEYSGIESNETEDNDIALIAVVNEPSSKRSINIKINKWFDINGKRMFTEQNNYLSLFNKIIDPNESEPFIDNLSDEVAWSTNGFVPFNQCYHKYFLAFWPKEYESRLFIRNDLSNYIKSTYKELLCDMESNFDQAMRNVELIVSELDKTREFKLNSGHVYNICESLRYIQNLEITKIFLNSDAFKIAYRLNDSVVNESLVTLVIEFGEEILKDSFLGFMSSLNPDIVFQNCLLVKELCKKDKYELAQLCFQNTIITFISHSQNMNLIQCQQMRENIKREVFILFKIFLNKDMLKLSEMTYLLKDLILNGTKDNLKHNCEILNIIIDCNEYEFILNSFNKNVLTAINDIDDFEKSLITIRSFIIKFVDAFKKCIIQENELVDFIRNFLIFLVNKNICYCKFVNDILREFIKNSQNRSKNSPLYLTIKQHLNNLVIKINDIKSYKMPDAKGELIDKYPEIKTFLLGNEQKLIFKRSHFSYQDYKSFAIRNGGNKNGYSLYIHAHSDYALIEKKFAIQRDRRLFEPLYEKERILLNDLLNLFE
jgi:hypothetical protein